MMFHQPIGRNQRTKGSTIKTILQVSLLLAIAIWLLYQVKHSYDKVGYSRNDDDNLSNGNDDDTYLGRKGKAGSENVIIIDTHNANFDESIERKEDGGSQTDVVDWQEKYNKEHEESQEDGSSKERQQEILGNEADNTDSRISGGDDTTNSGFSKGVEDVLDLPRQGESDNSLDQNDHRNGVDDSLEQDELPKDNGIAQNSTLDVAKSDDGEATSSDEETLKSDDNQSEISENVMDGSEHSETGSELSDDAIAGITGSSSSLPEDQSNVMLLATDDAHQREMIELPIVDLAPEITGNTTVEDSSTDARSNDESLLSEQKNAALINTETFERDTIETQSDTSAEADTSEKSLMETPSTDTRLEEELVDSAISNEGNNEVMPDSMDTTKTDEFESEIDNASGNRISEEEKSDLLYDSELVKLSLADDQNNLQREEVEAQGDNPSDAEITAHGASEEENTNQHSTDEHSDLSLANNVEKIAMTADTEDAKVEVTETQEGRTSDAENADNSLTEAKTETSYEDEVANSSQSDEQNDSLIPTNRTPHVEAIEPQEDGASEAQNTSDDVLQDTETHPNSNGQTNSESDGNGTAQEGEAGDTDSKSFISAAVQQELTVRKAAQ